MTTRTQLEADLIAIQLEDLNTAKLAVLEALEIVTDIAPTNNRLGSEANSVLMRLNSHLLSFEHEITRVISILNDESMFPTPGMP
jgi:hypothetical protein